MLVVLQDKGGRAVALRPEITPSLARLVLGKSKSLVLPAKWWTIGQVRALYLWGGTSRSHTVTRLEAHWADWLVAASSRVGLRLSGAIMQYAFGKNALVIRNAAVLPPATRAVLAI